MRTKIRSVGSRSHNLNKLLDENNLLYIGKNKKETVKWFNALGHSTPFGGTKFGLIRSISFNNADVKFSTEPSENVKLAEKHFGTTYKIAEAGYILTDGKMLDFSGRHEGARGSYRTVDHREIVGTLGEEYGNGDYSSGMVRFMSEGNIRVSPESGGINLSVAPNKAQRSTLDRYISNFRGEVILDIDDVNGSTVASVEYPKYIHSSVVLNDIDAYFDKGRVPEKFSQEPMTLKQLEAENKKLKKQLEYWRNQTRNNPKKTVRESDVKAFAKAIVESVPTDIKPHEIVPDLMELGNYILNEKELRYTEVHDMAERIATDLIENATEVIDDNKEMREELKSYLRTVKFRDDGSPEYKELRSKYRGRVHFTKKGKFVTNKGIGVDTAYMELQESLGYGLFPEEIINTAEQLEYIMMAVDRLAPIYRNPNTTYAKELIAEVTNSIIDGMLDETVRQSPLTAAERYQQRMFAQKKHFLELLAKQKEHNEKVFKEYKQRQAEKLAKKKMSEKNAAIRDKIQGVTKKIRKLYNSKDKHRNVKEVQKGFAGAALSLSNVLFSPATNADIVRAETAYDYATPEEAVLLNKYEGLLAKRDPLVEQYTSLSRQIAADNRNAKNGNPTLSEDERNAVVQQHDELKAKIADITPQIKALDKQLADLLKREKIRIDSLAVSKAVEELSNAYVATKDSEQSYASYEEAIKLRIDQLKDGERKFLCCPNRNPHKSNSGQVRATH